MSSRNKFLRQLEDRMQHNVQTLTKLPIVELAGDRRVLIEYHRGIREYRCDRICVGVCFGLVCVEGQNLEISRMTDCQLVITGRISSVGLERICT